MSDDSTPVRFPVRDLRAWADGSEAHEDRFRVERGGRIYDQAEAIRALLDVAEAAELHMRGQDEPSDLRTALARLGFDA